MSNLPTFMSRVRAPGARGLEPADVISRMFIAAHGRKVSGPTIFAETKNNSASISVAYQKLTFASSGPLSPGTESGLVLGVVPDQTKQPGADDKGCGSGEDRDAHDYKRPTPRPFLITGWTRNTS
jgi:hypothetical protein